MKKVIISILLLVVLFVINKATFAVTEIKSVEDDSVFGIPSYEGMKNYKALDVNQYIDKVWTYFSSNYYTDQWNWEEATYYLGVLEAYKATADIKYYNQAYQFAEGFSWECNSGINTTYLDDIATSLVYCVLHDLAPAEYKLAGVKEALDYTYNYGLLDYTWVDEIFMVGLAQTYLSQELNESKYSKIDLESYMFYREEFFDTDDLLWYRDGKYVYDSDNPLGQSSNGQKVYWGRGNAWVYVTLAQRMEYMDKNDPAYEVYKNDFVMLSEGLRRCVRPDGVWNPNLGDPNDCSGKEMTGTGGFLYGMSLGVRLGLLDANTYVPIIQKAYDTITRECIFENGFLGYCQPMGWQPDGYSGEEAMKNSTNTFGVGLMLMGLSQYMRLCSDYIEPSLNTPVLEFDSSKAIYTIEDGWYKGIMTVKTNATNMEENNGVANLVNGIFTRDDKHSRFTAFGLKSNPIYAEITLKDEIIIDRIIVDPYKNRAYKYVIEVFNGTNWVKVVDTTGESMPKKFLNKWEIAPINCKKIKITVSGCWNEDTDAVSIRELLIYEHKEDK